MQTCSPAGAEQTERTTLLFDGMAQGAVFQQRSGEIVAANPAAQRLLGLTLDQLLGRTSLDPRWRTIHEDGSDFPGEDHPSMVALRTGRPVQDVVMGVFNPQAGEHRWLRVSAVPRFREGERDAFEAFTTFEDITDVKRLEEALRRSEERFRTAAECSNDVLYEWHLDTDDVEYFGRSRSHLPDGDRTSAGDWLARLHADERDGITAEVQRRLADGRPYARRHRLASGDGRWRWVETRGQAIHDEAGRAVRWIGSSNDVTDHVEAVESLTQTLTLFEAVIEGTTDPVFVRNREGQYLLVNSAGAARLNRPNPEIIGRTNFDLLPPDMAEAMQASDEQVIRTGEPVSYESLGPGTGTYFTTKVPYRDAAGEIVGVLGIARDLTELKQLEEEYRQAQKMEAIGSLAGGVAHDFNNLLTVILGCVDEMRQGSASADDSLELIHTSAERAAELTSQLLAFGRRQALKPQPTDLNALMGNFARLLARVLGARVRLHLSLAPDVGAARVDPGQLEQVLMNLVVNASDAMPQGGRLRIATANYTVPERHASGHPSASPGPYVMVTVSDTGDGIPTSVLPRIFEPFFTTKGRRGTGLGLSTVYGIVKQSGGDVWVESEPGRGTTFKVILPRASGEAFAGAREAAALERIAGSGVILIVEDEDPLRALLQTVLRRQGYTVHVCPDVPDALAWLAGCAGPLDLVLTDMVMPGGTGLDLAHAIQARHAEVKLLLMSGYAQEAVADLGELEAGTHFIQKPFTPRALAQKVRDILQG